MHNALYIGVFQVEEECLSYAFQLHYSHRVFPTGGGGGDHTPPEITCPSSKTVFANYQGRAYVYYNLPVALDGNKPDGVT